MCIAKIFLRVKEHFFARLTFINLLNIFHYNKAILIIKIFDLVIIVNYKFVFLLNFYLSLIIGKL